MVEALRQLIIIDTNVIPITLTSWDNLYGGEVGGVTVSDESPIIYRQESRPRLFERKNKKT